MAISLQDATACVMSHTERLSFEVVAASAAAGRVTAQDVASPIDLPRFANSAMDGFAVRSSDTVQPGVGGSVELRVAGESRAGRPAAPLEPGCAARISTGAPLPEGADAVVAIEDALERDGRLILAEAAHRGEHIRPAGEDVTQGQVVIGAGTRLGAGELAMLASIGATHVPVTQRPVVAVLTTGDEVVAPGRSLGPGQIYESNSVMLTALARDAGAVTGPVVGGVDDDLHATIAAIEHALATSDVVVISGGVSKGEHDHVKPALDALGVRQEFWQVALRPGHPTWFGVHERAGTPQLVFGLPGNPVSAYVTFQLFAAPAIWAMCGAKRPVIELPATYSGLTQQKPMGMSLALRVRVDAGPYGVLAVLTATNQRSHIIGSMVGADGLAVVPPGRERIEDGDQVMVRLQRTGIRI